MKYYNKIYNEELDKLDNSFIGLIRKRTMLVKKVLALKDKRSQIIDQKRIRYIQQHGCDKVIAVVC